MLRHYGAAEVEAGLDYPRLVDALAAAFRRDGEPMPVRQAYDVGATGNTGHLLTMPAWERGEALGVKLVTVFPRNTERGLGAVSSIYVLFDGETGQPKALLDGEALTNRRTAAASALASRHLSRPESRTLLLVGTGQVAAHLPGAHRSVRPIERILVWGRSRDKAAALAASLARQGFEASPIEDISMALVEADIVSCATTSVVPLIRGGDLRPGTHVDLVGAFRPDMRESDDATILCSRVFVDTYAGALAEAGDLLQPIKTGAWRADGIQGDLHELEVGTKQGRLSEADITLFKSVGAAIEDLTAASLLVEG